MKKWIIIPMLYLGNMAFGQITMGEVVGEITFYSDTTKDVAIGAKAVIKDDAHVYKANAGIDGRFRIASIPSGNYLMDIYFNQDTMKNIKVSVPNDGYANLGEIVFRGSVQMMGETVISHNRDHIKLEYGSIIVNRLEAKDIAKMSVKFDMVSMIVAITSDVKKSDDGELMFRGSRKGDMVYMVDGIKSNEVFNIPSCAIGNMMVYTGGIPAKYGDTLGGVVIVESKSYFDLYRDWKINEGH